MNGRLSELFDNMTPQEQVEVETFAAFVVARRKLKELKVLSNDISTEELMQLVMDAGSFDWLNSETEGGYSVGDGEEVEWPSKS